MSIKQIILLNGPPRSGKDTVAELLCNRNPYFVHLKFAALIKEWAHRLYAVPQEVIATLDPIKDEPHEAFLGLSPRQAYIAISENYIKPVHGIEFIAQQLCLQIEQCRGGSSIVISDLGFTEELGVLIDAYGAGRITVLLLDRPNTNFSNDSRSYIAQSYLREKGVRHMRVHNHEGVDELEGKVDDIIFPFCHFTALRPPSRR